MAKMHIRQGDRVRIIRGNYRGQEGTVLRVEPSKNRVVVQGVNVRKRHRKPSQLNPEGAIVSFEAPIHASNVMIVDPSTGDPTRVRARVNDQGERERVGVGSGAVIPKA